MPVPKRKVSKSRRDKRSANKFIRPQAITGCLNCSHAILPHQACQNCGHYKGRKVLNTKYERTIKRGEARKATKTHQAGLEQSAVDNQSDSQE